MKFLKIASIAMALVLSSSASAALIDNDMFTTDTSTGLDWLDLTESHLRTYNDISSKFGAGEEFEGWRYATRAEVAGFWSAFGGDENHYNGWSTENNGLFANVSSLWGVPYCNINFCNEGEGTLQALTADFWSASSVWVVSARDASHIPDSATMDYFSNSSGSFSVATNGVVGTSSALVRVSAVPIPATVWLFGSGLIGLIGFARRKKA